MFSPSKLLYGIFTYIYHTKSTKCRYIKYTIHGSYGYLRIVTSFGHFSICLFCCKKLRFIAMLAHQTVHYETSRLSNASGRIAFTKWNMTWTTKKTRLYIGLLVHQNSPGVLPSSLWASSSMGFLTTLLLLLGHKKHLEVSFPVGGFMNPGFTLHKASHVMFSLPTFGPSCGKKTHDIYIHYIYHEPPKPTFLDLLW